MKTYNIILSAVAFMLMAVSCSKDVQTSFSEESLPVKIKVTGHVRYEVNEDDGTSTDPEIVKTGTVVNISYGIPDGSTPPVTNFSHKTVETNGAGYFECEIGCPIGKTMTIKASSSVMEDYYALDKDKEFVSTDTYFFKEIEKTAEGGKTIYFDLLLSPTAHTSEDGMTQPK